MRSLFQHWLHKRISLESLLIECTSFSETLQEAVVDYAERRISVSELMRVYNEIIQGKGLLSCAARMQPPERALNMLHATLWPRQALAPRLTNGNVCESLRIASDVILERDGYDAMLVYLKGELFIQQ